MLGLRYKFVKPRGDNEPGASFGNLIFGLGAGPPPKFWPARQQLLSCQQFFIKSRARSRSRFIKIGHTVSAQIKVEGRKRVCRSLTFATSTGIYHTIGAFKECSFLLIDGQFSLSQDVTKFMWRSSANKIREIRFPKPTQEGTRGDGECSCWNLS